MTLTKDVNDVEEINLSYKVKRQYVQISNVIDTSIKRPTVFQSIHSNGKELYIMFDIVDTAFRTDHLSSANFFRYFLR